MQCFEFYNHTNNKLVKVTWQDAYDEACDRLISQKTDREPTDKEIEFAAEELAESSGL